MNKPGKELKRIARQNLCGHFGIPMGVSLVATLLPLVLELPFSMLQDTHQALFQTIVFYVANFLISLVTVILSAGVIRDICRWQESSLILLRCFSMDFRIIRTGTFLPDCLWCSSPFQR